MNPLDYINDAMLWVTGLYGAPLLVAILIGTGYLLKTVPIFPNRFIPWVTQGMGTVLAFVLLDGPDPTKLPSGLLWPWLEPVAKTIHIAANGWLLSLLAWVSHAKLLKKWIDSQMGKTDSGDTKFFTPKNAPQPQIPIPP